MVANKQIVEVEGHRVYLTEKPGRPLMTLLRMAAGGMGLWNKVWPYLSEHFTVASIDLPAISIDKFESSRELFKHMTERVVTVVKGMNYDRFHLFGRLQIMTCPVSPTWANPTVIDRMYPEA